MPSRIQSSDVSTSTNMHRMITPSRIQRQRSLSRNTNPHHPVTNAVPTFAIFNSNLLHFARLSNVAPSQWACSSRSELLLSPGTYISNAPAFNLPPQNYFVAILCHVPSQEHVSCRCLLLRGAYDPVGHTVCLLITNISQSIHIHVPSNCDVFSFVNNPLLQIVVCHIKIDSIPPFTLIN